MLDGLADITLQRARGRAELAFDGANGRTRLRHLHQSGCLKVMLPRTHAEVTDAVLINTAGGLTGGDHLSTHVALRGGAELRLATQTAERIYKSTGGPAEVALRFDLEAGSRFDWLAQETILFQQGRVARRIDVDMDESASLLLVEPIVLGRLKMGERVSDALLHDRWRVRRAGALVFADDTRLYDFEAAARRACLGGATALASVLMVDPMAEDLRERIGDGGPEEGVELGLSAWNGMLLIRLLAQDPLALRRKLCTLIETLRGRDMPRVWTM